MNTPEKIYVHVRYKPCEITFSEVKEEGVSNVEYIREDAFIEKACDAYCKVCGHYAHSVPTHICQHDCRYFSDFKNYIKRE